MDLENSKPEPTSPTTSEEAQRSFAKHKDNYEKLRADIAVKMQFLDENRVSSQNCLLKCLFLTWFFFANWILC